MSLKSLALVSLFIVSPACAGQISFTVKDDAGTLSQVSAANIADADLKRVLDARRGQIDSGSKDAMGMVIMRSMTDAEVVSALTASTLNNVLIEVANHERAQAARAASDAIKPIAITPIPSASPATPPVVVPPKSK